jgi:hypothetical protein
MDPLSGSFVAEYFQNGNPPALSCGSMASVCPFQSISDPMLISFTFLAGSGKSILWSVIARDSTLVRPTYVVA